MFRLNDENGPRKVSRSSTNQLIADVANGLAAHIEGKNVNNIYHLKCLSFIIVSILSSFGRLKV